MSIPFGATKTASVNGASLAYREQGGGEPVVFVHGALSDLRSWEHQLPALGRTHRAIAYSRRFHRPNEGIDASVDDPWPSHVDDLVGFLRNVDAAPAHLVGNSQGAFISLLTAIRHPDLARTLVIEEPPVIPLFLSDPPRVAELVRLLVTRPRAAMTIGRFGTGTMAPTQRAFRRGEDDKALRIFGRGVLGEHGYEQLSQERREQMRENLGPLRALMLGAGLPAIRNEDVRAIRSPVLLVTGERSPTVLLRLTDRLEELLSTVERVEIPAASRLMHEDNPPALNEAVAEFLVRHSHRPTSPPPA